MTLPENPNKGISYAPESLKSIYLAGGCFWGTQAYLSRLFGVARTACGYANGHVECPTYEEVCRQDTGHAEAVMVEYSPKALSLAGLLTEFFRTINPTSLNRQGGDVGSQYRTGIYYVDPSDILVSKQVIAEVQKRYDAPVVTEVAPLRCFYLAEEYHQNYLEKNPSGYCHVDLSMLPPVL